MIPLSIRITTDGRTEEINRQLCIVWRGDDRRGALQSILKDLEEFASSPENREMVCEELDRYAPELSILAGHVAAINRLEDAVADRDLDEREMCAVADLRKQTANVWAHGRAGQILIDSQKPFSAASTELGSIARNIKGTRVRYIGDVDSIKGRIGVLTGEKRISGALGIECIEVEIDGTKWELPNNPGLLLGPVDDLGDQHAECDASEVAG